MAITLYHDVPSSNSDRVKIALAEKGLSWERIRVSWRSASKSRRNFSSSIPTARFRCSSKTDKCLFESCIINEYLDEKYPNPPLMPKDPYLRGRGRVLVDYALNYAARTLLGAARRDA